MTSLVKVSLKGNLSSSRIA